MLDILCVVSFVSDVENWLVMVSCSLFVIYPTGDGDPAAKQSCLVSADVHKILLCGSRYVNVVLLRAIP